MRLTARASPPFPADILGILGGFSVLGIAARTPIELDGDVRCRALVSIPPPPFILPSSRQMIMSMIMDPVEWHS
ncbi:hypothetical protein N7462_002687 [Penicillium macrosclerotiorum]|uniref:uncharacterized protein n=1 Tax=Penicillium macrosclerotiorum TaxID=303699 RepID=UPI00254771AF|nr:uncharacterized protein N7462_002687 [Penicillium macrosclerotiorum]KAJ5693264.1 hypothetical protein N7462_002687 [Penicillium macrosclerotiorum]